jgi:hypothetical protein
MRKNLLILFLCSLFTAGGAEAALSNINGYVCSATYTRQNHVRFGQGYVWLEITSAAGCSGSFLGVFYYLGSGATYPGFQFSESERLHLFGQATQSSKDRTRVNLVVERGPTIGGRGGGIFHTTYYGN